jgi:hypothetical protein
MLPSAVPFWPATGIFKKLDDSAAYGHYYQWGRNDDGHEFKNSLTTQTQATILTPVSGKFIDSKNVAFLIQRTLRRKSRLRSSKSAPLVPGLTAK